MSIKVSIVADSVSEAGARITTFELMYPRFIHAEVLTHRAFSRNSGSTRAIPTSKMIEWVEKDPAMPVHWGRNRPGMQATEELWADELGRAKRHWLLARDEAVARAKSLMELGVHKQIAGRILEPWAHINVVLTSTSFDNFFALRCHPAAMPEIQVLAVNMARLYRDSDPATLEPNGWHLPYVTPEERRDCTTDETLAYSVARCARVSYRTFEGKEPNRPDDRRLHDQLRDNGHWSPFEHQASPKAFAWHASGNFRGWHQYREMLPRGVHASFGMATLDKFDGRDFIV